jgi:hypothetical protein
MSKNTNGTNDDILQDEDHEQNSSSYESIDSDQSNK